MDALFQKAKSMYPNASDDEIMQGIAKIRQEQPNASDDEIVQAASKIQTSQQDGSFQKEAVKQSVMQKYGLGQYSQDARQKLVDENNSAASPIAAALAGFGAGLRGGDVSSGFKNAMDASTAKTRAKLDAFDKGRDQQAKDFSFERDLQKADLEDTTRAESKDPMSARSKAAQDMLVQDYGMDPSVASKMTAEQVEARLPGLKQKLDREMREREFSERQKDRNLQREMMNSNRQDAKKEKRDRQDEQDIQKLSKDVAGVQDMVNGLDEVEQELGGKLEEFTTEKGLQKGGKDVDLPGVSIPGLGRVSAYSDKAQRLQSAAAKVFNSVLKDRSGAAVSNSELERLKTEFGEGKYNTESQMVNALQRYKRAVNQELRNREAAYNPDVVSKYTEQGGRTSKSATAQQQSQPETKVVNGKTYRKVEGGWEEVE